MSASIAPASKSSEALSENPAEAIQTQMLLLKQAHFGEQIMLSPADKMEANRISGLPQAEQLSAYNEWALKLANESRKEILEQIAASTRSQIELSAKLDASEKARELSDLEAVKWKSLARVDELIKEALTKKALYEELQKAIDEINAGRNHKLREGQKKQLSVLFLDLDDFKKVNDTLKHVIGDEALKEFAKLIQANIRKNDVIARYGGEEFVVILEGASIENARDRAERIKDAVKKNLKEKILTHCPDREAEVEMQTGTVSIGVAHYSIDSDDEISAKELVDQADEAMYFSKNNGKNQVTVFDPSKRTSRNKQTRRKEDKSTED